MTRCSGHPQMKILGNSVGFIRYLEDASKFCNDVHLVRAPYGSYQRARSVSESPRFPIRDFERATTVIPREPTLG
jgi:hypothetical protein